MLVVSSLITTKPLATLGPTSMTCWALATSQDSHCRGAAKRDPAQLGTTLVLVAACVPVPKRNLRLFPRHEELQGSWDQMNPGSDAKCLLQLRRLSKEFEAAAARRGPALRELLEKEKALQAAASQLAVRKLKLVEDGKDASVSISNMSPDIGS